MVSRRQYRKWQEAQSRLRSEIEPRMEGLRTAHAPPCPSAAFLLAPDSLLVSISSH